jgi:hypothetical protein
MLRTGSDNREVVLSCSKKTKEVLREGNDCAAARWDRGIGLPDEHLFS